MTKLNQIVILWTKDKWSNEISFVPNFLSFDLKILHMTLKLNGAPFLSCKG